MAQRDYVGKKKKSKPQKNNSRIIPNLMMAFAVILVALFAGTLYFVSNNKSEPTTQTKKTTEKPKVTLPEKPEERFKYLKELEKNATNGNNNPITQPTPTITQSAQEKERQQILNSFMNDRPSENKTTVATNTTSAPVVLDQTTQTPSTNTVTKNKEQWLLQCGAFKDKTNAEALKAKIAMLGMSSSLKSGSLHRIIVGPFNSKLEADNAIKTLKSNGISGCINATK